MAKEIAENGAENGMLADTGMDKFQGFTTKDGEIQEPKAPAAPAKAGKPAAKAKAVAGDEDADTGDDTGGDTPPTDADAKRRSAQDRISKAVGRQRAAERERDELRNSNSALEQRLAAIEGRLNAPPLRADGTQPKRPVDPDAPSAEDYEFGELDSRYIADLARHETRKEIQAQQQRTQQTQQTDQQRQAQAAAKRAADEFKDKGLDKYDDFEDVVFDNSVPISQTLAELLFESDQGVDIAYQLASDPKEAKKVSAMSPARQAAWFGRKEAELSSGSPDADEEDEDGDEPPASTPKATRAPPPPATRTRGSGGQQQVSAATTDFSAFEKLAAKSN